MVTPPSTNLSLCTAGMCRTLTGIWGKRPPWTSPNSRWRPPDFHWIPQYFHCRPQNFIGDPQISIGDPGAFRWRRPYFHWRPYIRSLMKIWGSPTKIWGLQWKVWGFQWKDCCLIWKFGVSDENLGVSNEKFGVSNEKFGVSHKKLGVSDENLGVSNSTPMLMIFPQTPLTEEIVDCSGLWPRNDETLTTTSNIFFNLCDRNNLKNWRGSTQTEIYFQKFNKCGTNIYFLLYRGLVHHHHRIFHFCYCLNKSISVKSLLLRQKNCKHNFYP